MTVNIDQSTMMVDWSSESIFYGYETLENEFNIDLNQDGQTYEVNTNATTAVATDVAGATLREASDGSLYIKDGDELIPVTYPDGGAVDLNRREDATENFWQETKTIAVQKVDALYKLVVEQTTVLEVSEEVLTDIIYFVYDFFRNSFVM